VEQKKQGKSKKHKGCWKM